MKEETKERLEYEKLLEEEIKQKQQLEVKLFSIGWIYSIITLMDIKSTTCYHLIWKLYLDYDVPTK